MRNRPAAPLDRYVAKSFSLHGFNIFSLDELGVALGKVLAQRILPELEGGELSSRHDSSTSCCFGRIREMRRRQKPEGSQPGLFTTHG
mgnify:CR=1 FL=1